MFTDNFSPKTHRNMFLMPLSHSVVTLAQHGMLSDRHHQDAPHTAVTLAQQGMLSDRHHQDVPRTIALPATLSREYQLHDHKILKFKLFSILKISQAPVTCHSWSGNKSSAALTFGQRAHWALHKLRLYHF